MRNILVTILFLSGAAAMADGTVSKQGINSVDKSTCTIMYTIKNSHLVALSFKGHQFFDQGTNMWSKDSFSIGNSPCVISNNSYPIKKVGTGAEFIIPSSCQAATSDADHFREYENDRNNNDRPAWTISIDSLTGPNKFQFNERWRRFNTVFSCENLR